MKKITKYIPTIILTLLCSCSDYLDIVPDNVTTLDIVFNNRNTAERYLANCYHFVPDHGSVKRIPGMGAGHECWFYTTNDSHFDNEVSFYIARGLQNIDAPYANYWDGEGGSNLPMFRAIRECNIFLDYVRDQHKVNDLTDSERKRWIAEVNVLKAYYHFFLFEHYGPIPIVDLGAYDRMILMVFYLESKYGKDWADPTTSTLNYTADEIAEGIDFIKSLVDGHVIMSLPTYYGSNGDNAAHQSNEWITGKMAGIFEWDSSATKYQDALDEENKPGFTVGEEIKFGDYNGGFSKVSMGLAITKTCEHPAEAAMLINFLLNEKEGAEIMGSECGLPASKAGLEAAQAAGKIKELVAEANGKVMAFVGFQLDPLFEANDLKANGTGIYQEVFDTVDYDNASGADVVDTLLDGMSAVGYTV